MIADPGKLAPLSFEKISETAQTLRSDQTPLQHLRKRISDLKTGLGDLTSNNEDILDGLRRVAPDMP